MVGTAQARLCPPYDSRAKPLPLDRPDALQIEQMHAKPAARETGLTEQLMKLIIELRATARKDKNFAMADVIRKGLEQVGVTLEDRADGTIWRKE